MKKVANSVGKCPKCGGDVINRGEFYGCIGFREGCDFTVSAFALAELGHYKISPKQMRKLLKGPTQMTFKTSSGVERLFTVELKEIDGKFRPWIDFDAGSELEVLGSCPLCGADVVESPLSYGCSRWEEGCEFAIFKNSVKRFGGKMLSKAKAKELLSKGCTEVTIRAFDKSERKVSLLLDKEYGCKIDFGEEKDD
jgi:ssDNA-binding Zn-finger/Zn-ribbon topoisomerase 1